MTTKRHDPDTISAPDWQGGEHVRAKASLPGLDIEILHEQAADGQAERLAVRFTGAPDLSTGLKLTQQALLGGLLTGPGGGPTPMVADDMARMMWKAWLAHPMIAANPFIQQHPFVRLLKAELEA